MIKQSAQFIVFVLLVIGTGGVMAQGPEEAAAEVEKALHLTPDVENGKKVFMVCTVCHGPEGWASPDGMFPQIAGQQASVLIKQLADIRARNRDNPTMLPFTSPRLLGGAQEIADVAAYISALPMNPNHMTGPGFDLELGERVFKDECSECHGPVGEGDKDDHIPLIQGQNYFYLIRQFDWIRSGKRRNADSKMVKQIQRFTSRDELAVLDYVSRIRPAEEKLAKPGWQNPDFPDFVRHSWRTLPAYQMAR
ncbi:c-type cytochrome [Sedimenticola sp.]|uniref:c-type cytochrome n=1 Tax=Sedimenticola sp. TaxID=1940285 RepID=UPI003D0E6817